MEPTHTITLTIELPVAMGPGRHLTDLITTVEDYIERVNASLGEADSRRRYQWESLLDNKGVPVAELTAPMSLTGVAVARAGDTLLQYLSAVTEQAP